LSIELHDETATAASLAVGPGTSTFGTFGDINVIGLWTLYVKEVRRFLKVITQTVLAPMITTLIFLTVFTVALLLTIFGRKEQHDHMAHLPLDDDDQERSR